MDMAILLRKRTHLKKYEEALKQHNIPYVAVKGIGFYQEPEVAMLRSLIFFLSDPHDDYSLYVLLKSPLFRIEESDILELLNSEGSSLFDKLTAGSRNEDTPGSLFDEPGPARSCTGGAVADAAVTLTTWLAESAVTAISILIERVLVKTKAWMFFHDKQRQANIRKFIRIVEDLETNGKSLIKIRDVLERTADKSDEAKANVNTEGMDAVRIMTIHASKGLEFPIVFAPGMEEPFGVKTGENLIYEREGSFFYKSEPESSIRKQDEDFLIHQAREEEEQKRLFYVLVTRAEEALFLLGRWSSRDKNFLSFLRQGLGLEKEGAAFSLEADINGLSVLSGEDVNMLYAHAPSHTTEKKTLETITVSPLSIQKQTPWKSVTRTLESKGQDGQSRVSMGDILHRLFEGVSKGTISESDIMSRADIILQSMGFHDIAKDEKLELIEKEINTLKDTGVWQDIILPAEDSYTELPFVLGSEESIYSGRIDRMIKKDNVCRIYDYKTFPVTENEIPHLLKKYSIQLNIYKKAVQQIFNTDKVESYVVFTHTGEVKEV
jgi:ATP-dependent exoDNAse (exonuclease V) beta subunit